MKGDWAKLAAIRKQAEPPRAVAKDFTRNGLRFELEAGAFASVDSTDGAKRMANDWWRADGTKLDDAPKNLAALIIPKDQINGNTFREFVLRAHVVEGEETRRHFPGEFWLPPSPGQWWHTKQLSGADVLKFQLLKSIEIEQPATFALYFTDEPWSVSVTLDLDGKLHPNTELDDKYLALAQQFEVSNVEKLPTTTTVKVHPISEDTRRTHIALSAITLAGQTVRAIEPTADEGYIIKVPASEIEAFQISLRRMTHKATFENVATLPGQKTEPTVSLEPLDTLVHVTFRKDGKTLGRLSDMSVTRLEETLAIMQPDLNSETGELIIDTQLATTFMEAERIVKQLKASGWKWPTLTLKPLKNTIGTESSPPDGLEFLKPYPKLHGLSLDMTEPQFLEMVQQQESGSISFTVAEGPLDPTAGLPNSDEDTNPTNNTNRGLQPNPATGTEDSRRERATANAQSAELKKQQQDRAAEPPETELLRKLVRGGKIDTKTINALITLVASRGAQDAEFARLVLSEFEKSYEGGDRTSQSRQHLLAVLTDIFEAWSSPSWRSQLGRLKPDDLPQATPPQVDAKLGREMLARVIQHGYEAGRSEIANVSLAVRQLHHPAGREFLQDVLRNRASESGRFEPSNPPQTVPRQPPQTTPVPKSNSEAPTASRWKDNTGGGWTDAKFVAAVGLAELSESEGIDWLLARATQRVWG